jgi:hypothetical protein
MTTASSPNAISGFRMATSTILTASERLPFVQPRADGPANVIGRSFIEALVP